jgi:hypothetical protein
MAHGVYARPCQTAMSYQSLDQIKYANTKFSHSNIILCFVFSVKFFLGVFCRFGDPVFIRIA